MKTYSALSLFAFFVLSAAAVWLGGLNQDEGWYLYAANLVADGKLPYRDFFYTQGPLLPLVYAPFQFVWAKFGLLGARVFTASLGLCGILFLVALARTLVPAEKRAAAALVTFLLVGCNLYHLYYTAIPKTYALAQLFLAAGFFLLARALGAERRGGLLAFAAGLALAFAAGARISLGLMLAVVGFYLLFRRGEFGARWFFFGLGGALGLALVYGPFLADPVAREGLLAAQRYHAARGGFDAVFTVGSLSRLVRWYVPLFVTLGLGFAGRGERFSRLLLGASLAVLVLQMLAPYPYEDYQVPFMGLVAVAASVRLVASLERPARRLPLLATLGLAFATAFGCPLLETWKTNGPDRFWSLKKDSSELAQLREMGRMIEALDPNGKTLLTQDLYLAVETNRRVPEGLEMGPFSMLDDAAWRRLLTTTDCPIAALSAYTFAIDPPRCNERPVERQIEYWGLLKARYDLVLKEEFFGQNATTLLVLKKR